ncbi:protein rep [Megamonas funiformis]|uniref:Protein rep n=1 Tax=Megamonas funiformis TaxID=437897 RepID=A0AAW4UCX3_9FIRM|nr:protein rep [Megamonas funiformis]MCB6829501.1 protein rep [Megamonas funiformis]
MNSITEFYQDVNLEITIGTGEILQDYSSTGKERPWKLHKKENLRLVELYKKARIKDINLISDSRLFDLEHCGDTLTFLQNAEGKKKLKSANFCRLRLCPMCQWRRSLKMFSQVKKITDKILENDKSTRFIFGTFTIKNTDAENLEACINTLNKKFKYLVDQKKTFAPAKKLKQNLLGYLKAVEVTYNSKDKTYHPHLHVIFAVKSTFFKNSSNYMTKKEWIELWQKALNVDYKPQTDIRAIKSGTAKAVAEVAKYPVKTAPILKLDDDEAVEVLKTLTMSLNKKRFVAYGGIFKTVKQELKLADVETDKDLVNTDIEQQERFNAVTAVLFKYNFKFGCYIC